MEGIVFKPDETMRLCKCGCGVILEPTQKYYASRTCMNRGGIGRQTQKQEKKYPTWRCDVCNQVFELDFNPCGTSKRNIRFDEFKKNHYESKICQTKR